MADEATTSERPEGTDAKNVNTNAQDAIAQSLAALEKEAPGRTARRNNVPKVSTDDLFNAIQPRDDGHEEAKPASARKSTTSKSKTSSRTKRTSTAKSAEGAKESEAAEGSTSSESEQASESNASSVSSADSSEGALAAKAKAKAASKKAATSKSSTSKTTSTKTTSRKTASTKATAAKSTRAKAKESAAEEASTSAASGEATEEVQTTKAPAAPMTALLFQEPDVARARTRKRTPRKDVKAAEAQTAAEGNETDSNEEESSQQNHPKQANSKDESKGKRRGSRGRRKGQSDSSNSGESDSARESDSAQASGKAHGHEHEDKNHSGGDDQAVTTRRRRRRRSSDPADEVSAPKGSTRLEAKRQRRKEGREAGRRRHTITEAEYLARRESVKRDMVVREQDGLNQIAVLEDDVLVEHYVARHTQVSMVGNVYLGRVQNVLPSMEAAFVDIGKGRNAVLYAGEVNWEAAGMEGKPRKIEQALKSGDTVLVQVTKDPIGHKGARLTAQITLAGRHLVLVPSGAMTGISRKLPDKERQRLKKLLKQIVPSEHGVIVRTAAEGATEEQLRSDVERLTKSWEGIKEKSKAYKSAPILLKGEPELAVRVVRDIFNEDFNSLKIQGKDAWETLSQYVKDLSPELTDRLEHWTDKQDIFAANRVDEQLAKAFDRKVWLPSGGTLIVDRTEAMTVIDVNTGKFTGAGGTLEETVTKNNLEAAEEIVRQLRLRDIGGIIVVDFIDMVLEANRELVLRRLIECLGRDRTRHQVAEVTSLGLVQMTRKRVGQGLVEAFSTTCEACDGAGYITHTHPVEKSDGPSEPRRKKKQSNNKDTSSDSDSHRDGVKNALNSIAAAGTKEHEESNADASSHDSGSSSKRSKKSKKSKGSNKSDGSKKSDGVSKSEGAGASEGSGAPVGSGKSGASGEAKASSKSRNGKATADKASKGSSRSEGAKAEGSARASESSEGKSSQSLVKKAPAPLEKPAALRRAANAPVGKVEDASTKSATPAAKETKPKKARRVSSSGTITPGAGAGAAIMSFPKQ